MLHEDSPSMKFAGPFTPFGSIIQPFRVSLVAGWVVALNKAFRRGEQ
jgi:hypothetical protein